MTKDTCDPPTYFQAKIIIVASPDARHWGENQFPKLRADVAGVFKFFPVWEFDELSTARSALGLHLTDTDMRDRYRQVGGVPSHMIGSEHHFKSVIASLRGGLNELTREQAEGIAFREIGPLSTLYSWQRQSAITGFKLGHNDGKFGSFEDVAISSWVEERIFSKFIRDLWGKMFHRDWLDRMLDPNVVWKIFEAYTRDMMATGETVAFQCRPFVGSKAAEDDKIGEHKLGGCQKIRLVHDLVDAAKEQEKVMFHSVDPSHQLIDFLYSEKRGKTMHFHAFQVTTGKTHSANIEDIEKLQKKVGGGANLSLYYLVPSDNFESFATDPVNPREGMDGASCKIWHVLVPNPNANKKSS